jgi:hypothetical protein
MKRLNNKGSILVVVLVILYVLTTQSVSFSMFDTGEVNEVNRYTRSVSAFWLAEAGANIYMHDPAMLDETGSQTIFFGGGSIDLSKDDSRPLVRLINSLGTFHGVRKKVQIAYQANVPEVYKNAISTKGDVAVSGKKTSVMINDKTRVSGKVTMNRKSDVFLEDVQEGVDQSLTSLANPQAQPAEDSNGFKEFVQANNNLLSQYPPDQVLHLKGDDAYTIDANTALTGKKIIFIEGNEHNGNVVIQSNGVVAENQNLTIISTGTVTFNQSGFQAPNSQLNIIAWSGYNETVSAPSVNRGVIYTHGIAKFDQIRDTSTTNGAIIADGGVDFGEIWSTKVFNNADMTKSGSYPPGFENLQGISLSTKAALNPNLWREVSI